MKEPMESRRRTEDALPQTHETIWKTIALFLAGVVLTLCGVWATDLKSALPRSDFDVEVKSQRAVDEKMALQMSEIRISLARIEEAVVSLKEDGGHRPLKQKSDRRREEP